MNFDAVSGAIQEAKELQEDWGGQGTGPVSPKRSES